MDEKEGKEFLKCEYNKDGDSYRSPWTNHYFPPIVVGEGEEEPMYPSNELLEMEQKANHVFERYAKLYYDNNFLTSVFFFDTDNNGFGSCWLVKKSKFDDSFILNLSFSSTGKKWNRRRNLGCYSLSDNKCGC